MASARYWRLVGLRTAGGGDMELFGLHWYSAGTRVDAGATITCSHTPASGALATLQGTNPAQTVRFAGADVASSGFWLQWDFGSSIAEPQLSIGADQADTFPDSILLLFLDTDGRWKLFYEFDRVAFPGHGAFAEPQNREPGGFWGTLGSNAKALGDDQNIWTCTTYDGSCARASKSVQSGKWYWELRIQYLDSSSNGNAINIGVWPIDREINTYIYQTSGVRRVYQQALPGDVFGVAFDADDGFCTIRKNGSVLGDVSGSPLSMMTPWAPVIGDDNRGGALVEANFGYSPFFYAPPSGFTALCAPSQGVVQRRIRSGTASARTAASSPQPQPSARSAGAARSARDMEFGGRGRVYGTTQAKGSPNTPTKSRVRLLRERDGLLAREVWSDPVTGAFEFTGVDTGTRWVVLAQDASGAFWPAAASSFDVELLP